MTAKEEPPTAAERPCSDVCSHTGTSSADALCSEPCTLDDTIATPAPGSTSNIYHVASRVLGIHRHILPPDGGAREGCAARLFGSAVFLCLLYIVVIVGSCIVLWQVVDDAHLQHEKSWGIALLFTAPTLLISFRSIFLHTRHYVTPRLQVWYIRVLLFVPLYSLESWLALRFIPSASYLETLREIVEGYTIFALHRLLMVYLGGREGVLKAFSAEGSPKFVSMGPLCCRRPWKLDESFLDITSAMVIQYAVMRFVIAIVKMGFEGAHALQDAQWNVSSPWMWCAIVVNTSQVAALYGMIIFYNAVKAALGPLKAQPKFIVTKSVVFLTFWQNILIMGLARAGVIAPAFDYDAATEAGGYDPLTMVSTAHAIVDFVICVEMFFAAIAHAYFYGYDDFVLPDGKPGVVRWTSAPLPESSALFDMTPTPRKVWVTLRKLVRGAMGKRGKLPEKGASAAAVTAGAGTAGTAAVDAVVAVEGTDGTGAVSDAASTATVVSAGSTVASAAGSATV